MNLIQKSKRGFQALIWKNFWNSFQLPAMYIEEISPKQEKKSPPVMENICMPPYLGNNGFKDYSYLISIIETLKPNIILELGTAHGNTVANICAECDAKVYTVNALPEQIEGNIVTYTLGKDEIGSVYRKYGFEDRVVQIYENTKKINILDWVAIQSVDFAIIDACHDADFVVNDFMKIYPALSDRALVLFHDTNPSVEGHLIDSYLGCMYLRKLGFNVKYFLGSSWGVWVADDSGYHQTLIFKVKNFLHTLVGILMFGNQEEFIRALRWFASVFLRGKYKNLEVSK